MDGQIICSISDNVQYKNVVFIADRERLVADFEYFFSTYNTVLDIFITVFNAIALEGDHNDKLNKKLALETFRAFTPGSN